MSRTHSKKRSFHEELVLNQWLMGFFMGGNLAALKTRLGEDRFEGIDEDGQSLFFHQLRQLLLLELDHVRENDLRRYDLNIVQHWQRITEQRNKTEGHVLQLKYFQYLSLLFTEIYLDYYFNHRSALLDGLNKKLHEYNQHATPERQFQAYDTDELNKLAFWNATGSGKTLLLHVNILQYLHYFQRGNKERYPDKIILLTPNEGLSRQHLAELPLSGFGHYRLFDKTPTSAFEGTIEIIDINKLSDDMGGDKTVDIKAFEGNNLVLIDEGHRGTGSAAGAWMSRGEALVRGGFAFEYSATFGQAVASSKTVTEAEDDLRKKKAKLLFETTNLKKLSAEQHQRLKLDNDEKRKARSMATREIYAKNILFDYSYKYFYEDGYGKESLILNLKSEDYAREDIARQYFTACLLSFYQQQYLWATQREKLTDFNLEKPLWVFVGNTVAGEDSDILNVLKFLAGFLNDENQTKQWLKDLINNTARLLDPNGRNIFHDRFAPLMIRSVDEVYTDILKRLFNADARQRLKVVNLKNSKGELVLRVGDGDPFGLINIGDDAGFFKEAENVTLFDKESDDFGNSIFSRINHKDSALHILIGSRKFTEGWSSWRVSTMGLLNMGKGEGSQIIQLFGRGVRLKGKNFSLKRSIPSQRPKGAHLERLETLNIFGVNAGYMATFKEYLKEEGVTPSDEIIEIDFETRPNLPKTTKLKTLILKDGYKDNQIKGFKRQHFPYLYQIPDEFKGKIKLPSVELDLYPKIEAMSTGAASRNMPTQANPNLRHQGKINFEAMRMFDFDHIYLTLQKHKQERSWSNLRLNRANLIEFCKNQNDWYTLYIPKAELQIQNIADLHKQEDILIKLLKSYTEHFYKTLKNAYEGQFYDVREIEESDEAILKVYHFEIESNEDVYEQKIRELQTLIKSGKIGRASQWQAAQMVAICFDRHLYYPLFAIEGEVPLKMRPLSFDAPSEVQFVRDLESFYQSAIGKQIIGNRSLYLLRNADVRAKGLGFALAGNFYPDFLLWLVDETSGHQWLSFIDPKGLHHIGLNNPKLGLYKEIKQIQAKLNDPNLILNAFIITETEKKDLLNINDSLEGLENRHIFFMDDKRYLKKLFERIR